MDGQPNIMTRKKAKQADGQADGRTDRQTYTQTVAVLDDRRTDCQADTKAQGKRGRQTDRQTHSTDTDRDTDSHTVTYRQRDGDTDIQADRQTDLTGTQKPSSVACRAISAQVLRLALACSRSKIIPANKGSAQHENMKTKTGEQRLSPTTLKNAKH
jgi:hypothetical protein